MHDPNDLSFQRQCQKLFLKRFQIVFLLAGSDKMYQDFAGCYTTSQHQMAEIAHMLEFTIIGNTFFLKKCAYTGQDICHILMDQSAVVRV